MNEISEGYRRIETDNELLVCFLQEHCVPVVKCFIAAGMYVNSDCKPDVLSVNQQNALHAPLVKLLIKQHIL